MDKKNVQNQECQKTFVKISCVLYNKWPKGLKDRWDGRVEWEA